MKINEILLESSDHKLPALQTVFEAGWESQPIKHYSNKEQNEIHQAEEMPYDWKNQKSVWKYTGAAAAKWNDFLHRHYRGKSLDKDFEKYGKHIAAVDRELARNTFKKDYVLYTGLPESPTRAFKLYKQPTNQPLTVHLPAYTSTTTEWGVATHFATNQGNWSRSDLSGHEILNPKGKKIKQSQPEEGVPEINVLRIFVPAGTTGVSVSQISSDEEAEILLPRGLNIIISPKPHYIEQRSRLSDQDIYVWNAKVVGHTPQPVVFDQKD